jgi:hypothetical protein
MQSAIFYFVIVLFFYFFYCCTDKQGVIAVIVTMGPQWGFDPTDNYTLLWMDPFFRAFRFRCCLTRTSHNHFYGSHRITHIFLECIHSSTLLVLLVQAVSEDRGSIEKKTKARLAFSLLLRQVESENYEMPRPKVCKVEYQVCCCISSWCPRIAHHSFVLPLDR